MNAGVMFGRKTLGKPSRAIQGAVERVKRLRFGNPKSVHQVLLDSPEVKAAMKLAECRLHAAEIQRHRAARFRRGFVPRHQHRKTPLTEGLERLFLKEFYAHLGGGKRRASEKLLMKLGAELVQWAGEYARGKQASEVVKILEKEFTVLTNQPQIAKDIFTLVDLEVQEKFVAALKKFIMFHLFSEEKGKGAKPEGFGGISHVCVLDPIDGTASFIENRRGYGTPFTILQKIFDETTGRVMLHPIYSVMFAPVLPKPNGTVFEAFSEGRRALINGQTAPFVNLQEGDLKGLTTFFYKTSRKGPWTEKQQPLAEQIFNELFGNVIIRNSNVRSGILDIANTMQPDLGHVVYLFPPKSLWDFVAGAHFVANHENGAACFLKDGKPIFPLDFERINFDGHRAIFPNSGDLMVVGHRTAVEAIVNRFQALAA